MLQIFVSRCATVIAAAVQRAHALIIVDTALTAVTVTIVPSGGLPAAATPRTPLKIAVRRERKSTC